MKYFLPIFLFAFSICFSQNRKGQFSISDLDAAHELYVAFDFVPSEEITAADQQLLSIFPELESLESEYQLTFSSAIKMTEDQFSVLEQNAQRVSGNSISVQKTQRDF